MNNSNTECPCETPVFPQIVSNPPGRARIDYRAGDFGAFREALLRSRSGEVELANWRPGAQGDLAVQMIEWWAYVADILTFYNERIANESYLETASLLASVQGLIRILGYRPRPGIGATGTLAALMTGTSAFTLPQGFQVQSKPGPGKQPQIFELAAATLIQAPASLSADPAPDPSLLGKDALSVLLQGSITSIKPVASLLLLGEGWATTDANHALAVVSRTAIERDPRNNLNTRVVFGSKVALTGQKAADFELLRSQQSSHLWQYGTANIFVSNSGAYVVHLESIARQIAVGDPIVFDNTDGAGAASLALVTSYSEAVYYANSGSTADPTTPPATGVAIPILHSVIGFSTTNADYGWCTSKSPQTVTVRYSWQPIAPLIPFPSASLSTTAVSLPSPIPSALLPLVDQSVLISGAGGNGVAAQATSDLNDPLTLGLSGFSNATATLAAPLSVLLDLLPVTRGKTVPNEILGSGDATITTGQEFILAKSPLTYLQSGSSTPGAGYASTLQVWVNGVRWKEVASFYGQPPNAAVFVTREDDQNLTHVQFGDGVYGARLPSGSNNVVASYRYGSGADSPAAGSLNVILKSWPGLQSLVNPVPVGGGADPDSPQRIKTYAPASVLTFGRAISADDYVAIAAQAPGVARARSYWVWDSLQQRMMVKVYVGDDDAAVSSANSALASASDPNRPLKVYLASAIPITLAMSLVVDSNYVVSDVLAQVTAALIDPDQGLLGTNAIQVGESVWQSQIYQACLNVPGAVAVHDLQLQEKDVQARFGEPLGSFSFAGVSPVYVKGEPAAKRRPLFRPVTSSNCRDFRADPGEGGFFQLAAADLSISPEVDPIGN